MTERVYIEKQKNRIKLTFHYNTDLIDIMREFNGWYKGNEKAWYFPLHKLHPLHDALKQKMYTIIQS